MKSRSELSRRRVLTLTGAGAAAVAFPFVRPSYAQGGPLKVGLMLPYTGTYAQLGEAITRAMELYVKQKGGAPYPSETRLRVGCSAAFGMLRRSTCGML